MNYLQIEKTSINNGPGVRTVLWVSGCRMRCKGCQNPEAWSFSSGKLFDENAKQELFEALDKPYIKGITISGGHPLEPDNIGNIYYILLEIKKKFPTKDIWLYTGYELTIEDFISESNIFIRPILQLCDVVVDGPYIEDRRDITLTFRGSKNQRLINVKETLKQGEIITIQN